MIKRILAINFGGLGDEILFLPTLISLKKEYPNAKITLALEPRSKSIQQLTDVIDDVILVDLKRKNKYAEIFGLITRAIFGDFQMVVASGASPMMSIIETMTFIPKRYGYDTGRLSRFLLTKAIPLNKEQYAVDMYHDLVSEVTQYRTNLPEINVGNLQKIPNTVLIHPGVSLMSKEKGCIKSITSREWAVLIDRLAQSGKRVLLAGGPDDKQCIEEIVMYSQTKQFENLYGKTKNLQDLAKLIGSVEKFVCSDSAPLHIAVALKARTYAFFGPTDDKKLIPQNEFVTALKTNDCCELKPCLWERRMTSCEELYCLKYDFDKVVQTIIGN
ncbi:glycosyltransferase family 9 protein [bacterium]|nr:glycosyltransferase family 9 protein [bacterium]